MKKVLILAACALIAITGAQAKSKYEPDCKVSGFDNKTTCSVREYGAYVYDKPTILSSAAFGGIWVSADPDNIGLTISLGDISAILESVSINIDGDIQNIKVIPSASKSIHLGGRLWKSTGMIVVPIGYVEKILSGKSVKYRVSTVSKGYREGSFYSEKGEETEPLKSLRALLVKAEEAQK